MRIAVTGSTSAIGVALIAELEHSGFQVIPLGGRRSQIWQLGQSVPNDLDFEVLIHLAHDKQLNLKESNLNTDKIVDSFSGYKILLSSLLSHSQSQSVYGQSKLYCERKFVESGGVAIRAGLVFGEGTGGILQTLTRAVSILPFLPLPYSGRPKLFVSHLEDLIKEIIHIITLRQSGVIFGAHYWPYSLRSIVQQIVQSKNRRLTIINLGFFLTKGLASLGRKLFPRNSMFDILKSLEIEPTNGEISELKMPFTNFRSFNVSKNN